MLRFIFSLLVALAVGVFAWFYSFHTLQTYHMPEAEKLLAMPSEEIKMFLYDRSESDHANYGTEHYKNPEDPRLLKDVEEEFATARKLGELSDFKIKLNLAKIAVIMGVIAVIAYHIFTVITYITTLPLDSILDSWWGNFMRFYVGNTIAVVVFAAIGNWMFIGTLVDFSFNLNTEYLSYVVFEMRMDTTSE